MSACRTRADPAWFRLESLVWVAVSGEAANGQPAPGSSGTRRVTRVRSVIVGGAVLLVLALTAWWASGGRWHRPASSPRVVALVEFKNLSQNAADAWLGPALTIMLGAELGATDEIRVLPDNQVREAGKDLQTLSTGGYAGEALAQLRKRLGADYVVSGAYLIAAAADDRSLRIDIDLQDARSGAAVAAVSNQLALSSLNPLVENVSATLRHTLGVSGASAGLLSLIANTQPPSTAVAQRIGFALDAMARYDAARARDELLEAIAEAPDYTPAYLYLARAWSALGYRQKALAAAEQAARGSGAVPPELALQIAATVQTASYDFVQAAQTWKNLVALRPLNVEYRLDAIGADIAAGGVLAAQTAVADLQRMPHASDDPRVELAAARVAGTRNDPKSDVAHAQEALRLARLREAPGLIADAQVELAGARMHLGDNEQARTDLVAAIAAYRAMGNPHGEVAARRMLGTVLDSLLQRRTALEEYQHASALAQSIGDVGGVAAVYRNICEMLWQDGDRDGAQAAARRALQISRDTGDLPLQAWTLRALATISADEAATDEVLSEYREVTTLTERSHDEGGHVWSLATNADTLRMRGELDEAQRDCVQARTEAASLSDPQFAIYSTFTCALVAIDRGETGAARLLLEKVLQLSHASGNGVYAANAELSLGQIDFDASQWARSREALRRAALGFATAEARTGEADADALLALCAQALGDSAERDRAAARARELRAAITARQEVYFVDIALAQLADTAQQRDEVIAHLQELALDAERRHWMNWSLEAKLAEWQIQKAGEDTAAAARTRADLQEQAGQRGFGRIIGLLNAQSRPAP
jgi:tetratricopeptide (TPR) repeat protein